ncbi:MAG: VCBS repeat-containing protein, partial [Acidobacteriota bacterium]
MACRRCASTSNRAPSARRIAPATCSWTRSTARRRSSRPLRACATLPPCVTQPAGVCGAWRPRCCAARGRPTQAVHASVLLGQDRLYLNRGDGSFDNVTAAAGLRGARPRWGSGCAFLDIDRDGRLDL